MNCILSRVLQQQEVLHRLCKVASQVHFLHTLAATLLPRVDAWDNSAQMSVYSPAQFCCPKGSPSLGSSWIPF